MQQRIWNAEALIALTTSCGDWDLPPLSHFFVRKLVESGFLQREQLAGSLPDDKMERVRHLLSHMDEAEKIIARYEKKGFRLLLPDDDCWPRAFRKLGSREPCYLFVLGNTELLNTDNRISVAGSRDLGIRAAELSERLGRILARHGCSLVSGCARGTDSICQEAVLAAGGNAVLFPAIPVREAMEAENCREALEQGRIVFAAETLPELPFSAAKALSRNHMIYAMGDPALVVAARSEKGGSWKGAADCLHAGWSPLGVFIGEETDFEGCNELVKLGATGISAKGRNSDIWKKIEAIRQKAKQETKFEQMHF